MKPNIQSNRNRGAGIRLMMHYAVLAVSLSVAPLSPAASPSPSLTITDSFDDAGPWSIIRQGGDLTVTGGKMNYTSAGTGNAFAGALRSTPLLSTAQDWSLSVDVHLDSTVPLTVDGQYTDVFLGVGKTGHEVQTHLIFEFSRGLWGGSGAFDIGDDVMIDGTEVEEDLFTKVLGALTAPESSLRLVYRAADQTITYLFDADGPTGGYNWVAQGTANIASGPYDLGMGPSDTFTILLSGSSEHQTVATGKAYLDNLVIATGVAAPVIVTQPVGSSKTIGATASFGVTAAGSDPLAYQWRKDGVNLANGGRFSGATDKNLTITSIQASDAGSYTVVVSNASGSITSSAAVLEVDQPAGGDLFPIALDNQWTYDNGRTAKISRIQTSGDTRTVTITNLGTAGYVDVTVDATSVKGGFYDEPNFIMVYWGWAPEYWVKYPMSVGKSWSGSLRSNGYRIDHTSTVTATDTTVAINGTPHRPCTEVTVTVSYPEGYTQGQTRWSGMKFYFLPGVGCIKRVRTSESGAVDVVQAVSWSIKAATGPQIIQQPQSQTLAQAGTANFAVEATGTLPITYQWRKNGLNLTSQTNRVLLLAGVKPDDAGNYDVVVANAIGMVTSTVATLTVLVPPSIVQQPQSQTITQGMKASFQAVVAGSAPLQYRWFKGGVPIGGATFDHLTIENVTTNDAGEYRMSASNPVGSVTSLVAVLTVLVPPRIVQQPADQTSVQNGGATFLLVADGTQPLTYQWKRDGIALNDGLSVVGSRSNVLTVLNLSTNDTGARFSAVVANTAGTTTTRDASLTVALKPTAPQIVSQPSSQTVGLGGTAKFETQITGWPVPGCRWFFSGAPLSNGGPVSGADSPVLMIAGVSTNHQGAYSLVATNAEGGMTSRVASLVVVLPPRIVQQPGSLTIIQGGAASFEVQLEGTPPFSYQWTLNGALLAGSTTAALALSNVQPAQAGSYAVVVTNLGGSVTSTGAVLTVLVPPQITRQPTGWSGCAGDSTILTLTATGTAPLSYQWRKDGRPVPGAVGPSLALTNIQTEAAGVYDVLVTNFAGSVGSAPVMVAVNAAPTILSGPTDTTVTPGGAAEFNVLASGTAPLAYQWRRDGTDMAGQTNASLILPDAREALVGSYSVRVCNTCGCTDSASARLRVVNRALQVISTNGTAGSVVSVPVQLVGNGEEALVQFGLLFSAELGVPTVALDPSLPHASLVWTNPAPGELGITVSNTTPGATFAPGTAHLATLQFTLPADLTNATLYQLRFGVGTQVLNTDGANLPLDVLAGTLASDAVRPPAPRPGTGLFQEQVAVSTTLTNRALRVLVHDLGVDSLGRPIELFSVTNTLNGVPYLDVCGPFSGGTPVVLTMDYLVRDRKTVPKPIFEVQDIPSCTPVTPTGVPILPASTRFLNGAFYLEIPTQAGHTYYIQYAGSATGPWDTAYPPLNGNGGHMVWVDNGPPKTASPPTSEDSRFYRAIEQ